MFDKNKVVAFSAKIDQITWSLHHTQYRLSILATDNVSVGRIIRDAKNHFNSVL